MRKIRTNLKNVITNGIKIAEHVIPVVQYNNALFKLTKNKYKNIQIIDDGQLFHSISEWKRWRFLRVQEHSGYISQLKCQVCFQLQKNKYVADFTYIKRNGEMIIEDVKSPQLVNSPRYRLNKRQMKALGYDLRTVSPTRLLMIV